jgi:preflagellin peptidase FlaK
MQQIFAAAQLTLTIGFLLYASWSDYKTREVSNKVWVIYAPIALVLSLIQFLFFNLADLWLFGVSAGVTFGFAFLLFFTGAFGGADSKALMCLALSLPFFPVALVTPLLPNGLSPLSQMMFPLTVICNAVLIAALSSVYLLLRNLASTRNATPLFEGTLKQASLGKKMLVLLTGHKFALSELKAKWHIYPMEDILPQENAGAELQRTLVVVPKDEGRDEIVARLSTAAEEGKICSKVWATPGLPMLIFVTVGLFVALVFGDLVWVVVSHLFV